MLKFDTLKNDYPSRRSVIYGRKGMVCTSQPLAAQAGLDIIKQGGNAIDAAIATAACMTVLEPTSNGIGSDAFALVWTKGELHGLNASGRAPMAITAEKVKKQGYTAMPKRGWIPVMVPGAPSAWAELSEKFGRLTLEKVMEPAVTYAREGYPVSPVISKIWNNAYKEFIDTLKDESFKPWFDTFARDGHAPQPGEIWKSEAHAKTLEKIAKTHAKAFYQGELGDQIDEYSRKTGGYLRKSDLENYWCQWVKPIHVNYRGYDVCEIPPNGDGIIALMALNILKGYSFEDRNRVDTVHKQLEAMKLAFADGNRYVADPEYMRAPVETLLSDEYAAERRSLIGEMAQDPEPGDPFRGGTDLSLHGGWGRKHGLLHPEQLYGIWLRHRDPGDRNRAAEPWGKFYPERGHGKLPGTGKEVPSHDHSGISDEGWKSCGAVRRHGWFHAAPGTCAGNHEHSGFHDESARDFRCAQMAVGRRKEDPGGENIPGGDRGRTEAPRT